MSSLLIHACSGVCIVLSLVSCGTAEINPLTKQAQEVVKLASPPPVLKTVVELEHPTTTPTTYEIVPKGAKLKVGKVMDAPAGFKAYCAQVPRPEECGSKESK